MNNYPIVPGRGLNTEDAKRSRIEFLHQQGIDLALLSDTRLGLQQIQHNIESFIGSVEIPLGLAGPLLLKEATGTSWVYAPVGTLEGALVASMNRGAKVVSQSGGYQAVVLHQKMIRSPMFIFRNLDECLIFKRWVDGKFDAVKKIAEQYSNHAELISIDTQIAARSVHLKMVYTTGDASGQNMTTTCTAHALNWIRAQFKTDCNIDPVQYVIEGNAASDKKVSHFSMSHGRGIHVVAECFLQEAVIEKILRVRSEDFVRCLQQSRTMSKLDGMLGYNINVANAIAAIFVATGQDLASIHESGLGLLHMEKTEGGLYCALHLPALVIGTVGGGTHLCRQQEALRMMGCAGTGKASRLARIIAGFALALEISTFAAIIGGQFAKVHEKLGRNKPVNWLVRGEIGLAFLQKCLQSPYREQLRSVHFLERQLIENGLIIGLTSRINKKLTGFVPLSLNFQTAKPAFPDQQGILLKSKPLDEEVYQGLHYMAAAIDPQLADLLSEHQSVLEYKDCHLKEIKLYQLLDQVGIPHMPRFYGSLIDSSREIYILLIELLENSNLQLFNTENRPEAWLTPQIEQVIEAINEVHHLFYDPDIQPIPVFIPEFFPWNAQALYHKFAEILALEYNDTSWRELPQKFFGYLRELESLHTGIQVPKTVVHNDFNPRNIAVRSDGQVCIYDWELAVIDFPHRDIVEFLSFVLPQDFEASDMFHYLRYHHALQSNGIHWREWKPVYSYSLKTFLLSRVSFYMTGKILMDYKFAERVFLNAFRMIQFLEDD